MLNDRSALGTIARFVAAAAIVVLILVVAAFLINKLSFCLFDLARSAAR